MGKKAASSTPRKPRASKKRAAPGSKGLSPAECRDASLPELSAKIESHGGVVLTCYKEPLGGNATNDQARAVFADLVEPLLEVSKCPDFVVNRGHLFGTDLPNDDKAALIEFLKTF